MNAVVACSYDRANAALFVSPPRFRYADLHSTVAAGALQAEGNRLPLRLGHWMTPGSVVFAVKGISHVALTAQRRARRGGAGQTVGSVRLASVGTAFPIQRRRLQAVEKRSLSAYGLERSRADAGGAAP